MCLYSAASNKTAVQSSMSESRSEKNIYVPTLHPHTKMGSSLLALIKFVWSLLVPIESAPRATSPLLYSGECLVPPYPLLLRACPCDPLCKQGSPLSQRSHRSPPSHLIESLAVPQKIEFFS